MSFEITNNAEDVLSQKVITPQIVCEIEGYGDLLTSAAITEIARFDNPGLFFDMPGLFFDVGVSVDNQQNLISLNGTTNQITQQILQDQAEGSSTTNVTIAVVNKDNVFSDLVTPSVTSDLISKKATVYLGAEGMNFPEDFIRIFVGNVTSITMNSGMIRVNIAHPENQKRSELFVKAQTELGAALTNIAISLTIDDTSAFILPKGQCRSFVKIDDEIIEYTGKSSTQLTGLIRGSLGTLAAAHDDEAPAESFYMLGDATSNSNALDLALQVMISGQGVFYTSTVSSIGISASPLTQKNFYFENVFLKRNQNVQAGDNITVTLATNAGNNVTSATILDLIETELGTQVIVANTLIPEATTSAVCAFTSQYDTLPDGLALAPDQVDIDEFLKIKNLFGSSLPNYKLYLKDTISGKDLVNKEILFPAACFSIPRKGRISVGKTRPPIAEFDTRIIDENTVLNASNLVIERSSTDNFYNSVVYRFEESAVEDKFLAGRVTLSADSTNRIKVGNKTFTVESKGLRKTTDNEAVIQNNAQRLLDRYQFGAEIIRNVLVPFTVGWATEVGDTVIVQGLNILDSKTGETNLSPRIMEVTNRSFNFRTGQITLDLTDTAFEVEGRYGVISPSSILGTGSTTTELVLLESFSTPDTKLEKYKWQNYVGQPIIIHSPDYSTSYTATITGFSPSNDAIMTVSGLSTAPAAGLIIDIAEYDTASALLKATHVFFNPHLLVTANSGSQTQFTVADDSFFFIGSVVKVHDLDWSLNSVEAKVTNIAAGVITVDRDLGFNPQTGHEVELIGFVSDEGTPYRTL